MQLTWYQFTPPISEQMDYNAHMFVFHLQRNYTHTIIITVQNYSWHENIEKSSLYHINT